MNIGRALAVAVIGLALMSAPKAMADEVLYHVHFTALTPLLRDLVTKEFRKDPDLKVYLNKADIDFPYQDCRDPLTKI